MWWYVSAATITEPLPVKPEEMQQLSNLLQVVLEACAKCGRLDSLTIQTKTYPSFDVVLSVLKRVKLSLVNLSMFPNEWCPSTTNPKTVASIDLYRNLSNLELLKPALHSVNSLSIALTSQLRSVGGVVKLRERATRNIAAVYRFLDLMPEIRSLDLRWMSVRQGCQEERMFLDSSMGSAHSMHQLESCALRGFYLSEKTLLAILRSNTLRRITLAHLTVIGSFSLALEVLTSGKFDFFELNDIFEDTDGSGFAPLLYFQIPGRPKFPCDDRSLGPSKVIRENMDTIMPLQYTIVPEGPTRHWSKSWDKWVRWNICMYGHRVLHPHYV